MDRYIKIRFLLRLAELCSTDQAERKKSYMNEIDSLLATADDPEVIFGDAYNSALDFFDFSAPAESWKWVQVSDILSICPILEDCSLLRLGKILSKAANANCGIKRRHVCKGTQYFLPPRKHNQEVLI